MNMEQECLRKKICFHQLMIYKKEKSGNVLTKNVNVSHFMLPHMPAHVRVFV